MQNLLHVQQTKHTHPVRMQRLLGHILTHPSSSTSWQTWWQLGWCNVDAMSMRSQPYPSSFTSWQTWQLWCNNNDALLTRCGWGHSHSHLPPPPHNRCNNITWMTQRQRKDAWHNDTMTTQRVVDDSNMMPQWEGTEVTTTCNYYQTTEFPQEHATCGHWAAALAAEGRAITQSSWPKVKKLNLSIYRYYALRNYLNTIRRIHDSRSSCVPWHNIFPRRHVPLVNLSWPLAKRIVPLLDESLSGKAYKSTLDPQRNNRIVALEHHQRKSLTHNHSSSTTFQCHVSYLGARHALHRARCCTRADQKLCHLWWLIHWLVVLSICGWWLLVADVGRRVQSIQSLWWVSSLALTFGGVVHSHMLLLAGFVRSGATYSNFLTYRPFMEWQTLAYLNETFDGTLALNPQETMYMIWIRTNGLGVNALLMGSDAPGMSIVHVRQCAINVLKHLYKSSTHNFIMPNVRWKPVSSTTRLFLEWWRS